MISKPFARKKHFVKLICLAILQTYKERDRVNLVLAFDSICRNRDYAFVLGNSEMDFIQVLSDAYDTDLLLAGMVNDPNGDDVGFITVLDTTNCQSIMYRRLYDLVWVSAVHRGRIEDTVYYYLVGYDEDA